MVHNGIRYPFSKHCTRNESVPDPGYEPAQPGREKREGGGEQTMDRRDRQSAWCDHPSHLGQPSLLHVSWQVREDGVRDDQIERPIRGWGGWVGFDSSEISPLKMGLAPAYGSPSISHPKTSGTVPSKRKLTIICPHPHTPHSSIRRTDSNPPWRPIAS